MSRNSWSSRLAVVAVTLTLPALAAPTDDLVFIHHSVGENWLNNSLDTALVAKGYIDERNDITYGTDLPPDPGRPDSLAATPGDLTDMCHWIRWFNDYLATVTAYGCADGVNRIIMFKSCFPNSDISSDGTEPGDPFSSDQTLANYRALFRHPDGAGHTYTDGATTYQPLEDIFAANPNTLFIYVTAPPLRAADTTAANAHRARLFNNWVKGDWLASYNTAHPGLNNVAVFDLFDLLAYPDADTAHPNNRLRSTYATGDSHPNDTANALMTQVFATNPTNFLDTVWAAFPGSTPGPHHLLTITTDPPEAQTAGCSVAANPPGLSYPEGQDVVLTAHPADGWVFSQWSDADTSPVKTVAMDADVDITATFEAAPALSLGSAADLDFGSVCVGDVAQLKDAWTLKNTGGGTLDVTVSVDAPFHVSVDGGIPTHSCPFSLGAAEEKKVTFDFAPLKAGRATRHISVASNGGDDSRTATGLGTLPIVSVAATDPKAAEPGTDTGEFTVTRSGGVGLDLVVGYSVGGSARNGADYTRLTGTVTIPQGQLSATIPVVPIDDSVWERDETVILTLLGSPRYRVDPLLRSAKLTLSDDEPTLSIAATTPAAAEEGPTAGEFTVTRSGNFDHDLTVFYTVGGTARNGADYVRLTGQVLIPNGSASAPIPVTPIDDTLVEPDETVVVTLSPRNTYSIDANQRSASVVIADNDPAPKPRLGIAATIATIPEQGPGFGQLTVTRLSGPEAAVTVLYAISGTARNGTNYQRLTSSVLLPQGQPSVTIQVTPIDNLRNEPDKTVLITLRPSLAYSVDPTQQAAAVIILDND